MLEGGVLSNVGLQQKLNDLDSELPHNYHDSPPIHITDDSPPLTLIIPDIASHTVPGAANTFYLGILDLPNSK